MSKKVKHGRNRVRHAFIQQYAATSPELAPRIILASWAAVADCQQRDGLHQQLAQVQVQVPARAQGQPHAWQSAPPEAAVVVAGASAAAAGAAAAAGWAARSVSEPWAAPARMGEACLRQRPRCPLRCWLLR
jgi:hypothetical protein